MRSSSSTAADSGMINIAASAQKLDVDNRIALRFYYRVADNILRQADIFRAEKNIIDLYVLLLRFSSLASETIPRHREYRSSPQTKKQSLKKRLNELEKLKPLAQQKINEIKSRNAHRQNGRGNFHSNNNVDFSSVQKQTLASNGQIKPVRATAMEFAYQGSSGQHFSHVKPVEEHVRRLSLTLPPPKEETLSRHSILGPNGLNGQWRSPTIDTGVRYPSNVDLSPVELPSLQRHLKDVSPSNKDSSIAELHKLDLNSIPTESEISNPALPKRAY
ncbi:unnamed protein product [Lathyrus sativus]|nr:unnamed protein product [Lathyrus sativus]